MKEQQITIFMNNGTTLRFNKVSNFDIEEFDDNERIITFDYVSTTQGTKHSAEFYYQRIAGLSILAMEEE